MTNILKDSAFKKGFMLKGLNSIRDGHKSIRDFTTGNGAPDWFLCQWNSKYNLTDGEFSAAGDGFCISDKSKCFTSDGKGNAVFSLKASKEFSAPRKPDEGWPHLLIEQEFESGLRINSLKQVLIKGTFKLDSFADHMNGGNMGYHTTQFVWVVVFSNENKASADYGRFIWVVLGLLDTRYDFPPLFTAQDSALPDGEFIYSFDSRAYLSVPVAEQKEVSIEIELLQYLPEILNTAQKYGFMKHTRQEDLELKNTNMGFEITGTYDAVMNTRDLGIYIEKRRENA